jgi:hypothetical protein
MAGPGRRKGSVRLACAADRCDPTASIIELIGGSLAIGAAAIAEKLHLSAAAVSYHTKILGESGLLATGLIHFQPG